MSYGVKSLQKFITGVHLKCDKIWDAIEREHKAANQMTWFLSKVPPTLPDETNSEGS